MSKFKEIIKDVVGVLNGAALLNTLLNTCSLFILLYLIFTLFNLFPFILASIISLFYLMSVWFKKTEKYTAKYVETKFPELKDKLTTAKDTLNDENFVVNKLRVDVAKRIRGVDASNFFNMGRSFGKLIGIIFIIFVLLTTTALDFRILDLENKMGRVGINFGNTGKLFDFLDSDDEVTDGLEFHLTTTIDVTDIQDVEDKEFKKEEFISYDELHAIGAKEYKDPITEEEKEIVKNYFDKINEK